MRIVILGAFKEELATMMAEFADIKETMIAICRCWQVKTKHHEIIFSLSGIGTSAAAITTTILCEHIKPDLIVFCGVAGGLQQGMQLGDLVLADKIIDIDLYLLPTILRGTPYESVLVDPHSLMPNTYEYDVSPDLFGLFAGGADARVQMGTIVTSNIFPAPKEAFAHLKQLDCAAIEMESAGMYKAACYYHVPVMTLRAISNVFDEEGRDLGTADHALALCARRLASFVRPIFKG